jgi:uncharacterized membrane protein YccF (DUF307 family)
MTVQPPTVVELKTGPSLLVRAVWYILVGWWLTAFVMGLAWFLAVTIIGLPVTFYLVNRIPTLLTLRPRYEQYAVVAGPDGIMRHERIATEQTAWPVRLLYFLVIGWWLSLLWMVLSYALMITILGIPFGLMLVNRLPFVFSLHRGYA